MDEKIRPGRWLYVVGALIIKKTRSTVLAFSVTLPIHAVLEALAVIPFGFKAYQIIVVTGVGSALHHTADAIIAASVLYLLKPYMSLNRIAR
jgi:niacin transporter